jgi:uncharacterized protein (TIGR03067 family)
MNSALILGVVVGVSAPTIKDPPKKESTIVGEWLIENTTSNGNPQRTHPSIRYEFTTDGQLVARRDDAPTSVSYYKVDSKADPPTIDVGNKADALVGLGIFKLEGDTMLWCVSFDNDKRPKAFEAANGSRQMLVVLKRVKKKE